MELLEGRDVPLGRYSVVRRTLPNKARRTVGAWCFLDHFGPEEVTGKPGMRVPPHPHIGLQTVTWLFDGEIRHRDSLGSDELIRPGQLNIMTSGRGHRALRGLPHREAADCCTGCSCGWRCPTPARHREPALPAPRGPAGRRGPRGTDDRRRRVPGRGHLAGRGAQRAGRRRLTVAAVPLRKSRTIRPSSTRWS